MSTLAIEIPEDLLEGILTRLPVKALLRFRCVCKFWCALIDNPSFTITHYHQHYTLHKSDGTMPLFVWQDKPLMCHLLGVENVVLNLTVDLKRDTKLAINYPRDLSECYPTCPGIANGIVCIQFSCDSQDGRLNKYGVTWNIISVLWNPATRDVKILPEVDAPDHKGLRTDFVGFGFDHLSNDFKVIARFFIKCDIMSPNLDLLDTDDEDVGISTALELYSLRTNSWKRLPYLGAYIGSSDMDACLNGVYYWTVEKTNYHLMFCILSFNFSTEEFKFMDPPQGAAVPAEICYPPEFDHRIGLYKEFLALIFMRAKSTEAIVKVDIWAATKFDDEDFGFPLEWQCLLVIEPFPISPTSFCVITPRLDGQLLFKTYDADYSNAEWSLYDPETHQIKKFGIRLLGNCFRYVESLFPISRMTSQT